MDRPGLPAQRLDQPRCDLVLGARRHRSGVARLVSCKRFRKGTKGLPTPSPCRRTARMKPTTAAISLADVERAAALLEGAVVETDCDHSRTLSALFGCEIWLKFENL